MTEACDLLARLGRGRFVSFGRGSARSASRLAAKLDLKGLPLR